jgi:hypothetical protein
MMKIAKSTLKIEQPTTNTQHSTFKEPRLVERGKLDVQCSMLDVRGFPFSLF